MCLRPAPIGFCKVLPKLVRFCPAWPALPILPFLPGFAQFYLCFPFLANVAQLCLDFALFCPILSIVPFVAPSPSFLLDAAWCLVSFGMLFTNQQSLCRWCLVWQDKVWLDNEGVFSTNCCGLEGGCSKWKTTWMDSGGSQVSGRSMLLFCAPSEIMETCSIVGFGGDEHKHGNMHKCGNLAGQRWTALIHIRMCKTIFNKITQHPSTKRSW